MPCHTTVLDCSRKGRNSSCAAGAWPTTALDYMVAATQEWGGLATHAGYAYKQKNGKCKHAKVRLGEVRLGEVRLGEAEQKATTIGIRGYYQVDYYGWLGLLLVVNAQPTIPFVRGSYPSFQTYTDGINSDAGCAATGMVDHSVLVTKGAHTATHGAQWRAGVMMQRRRGIYNDAGCAAAGVVDHSVLVMGYSITAEGAYWILRNSWGATWGMQGYMQMAFGGGIGICGIHSVPAIYPIVKTPSLCLSLQNQYGGGGTCGIVITHAMPVAAESLWGGYMCGGRRVRQPMRVSCLTHAVHRLHCAAGWVASASSPIVIIPHRHHPPSLPSPIITIPHHHHSLSSPPPIITTPHHHHPPSSPLSIITIPHHHHPPSSSSPIITTPHHHHPPSSPSPACPTSPHSFPYPTVPLVLLAIGTPKTPLPPSTSHPRLCPFPPHPSPSHLPIFPSLRPSPTRPLQMTHAACRTAIHVRSARASTTRATTFASVRGDSSKGAAPLALSHASPIQARASPFWRYHMRPK
ncbi:unnamed protein product [Closterium sp. NIES-64]|nr:unnamed protein product [Closterium sp. NIES-64]